MGRQSALPPDQLVWLDSMSQQLLCKIKNNDTDIDTFVKSAEKYWEEYWGPKTPQEKVTKYRKSVQDRFKNNRFRAKGDNSSSGTPGGSASLPTFFSLAQQPAPTPYELFRAERSEEINKAVNKQRENDCMGHQHHLGLLRKELSSEYRSTKSTWIAKARGLQQDKVSDVLSETQCQEVFTAQMEEFLESLLGRGRGKIGNGSFALLYSYRTADNTLKMGCINATANKKAPKLPALFPLEYNQIKSTWGNYCNQTIPLNHDVSLTPAQQLFKCSEDGCPYFPIGQLDPGKTPPVELEDVLRNYFQAQYDYAWSNAGGAGFGPMDWEHVEYSDMLSHGLELRVPIDGDYGYVYQLYNYFDSQLNQPIQVFKIKDTIINLSLSSDCLAAPCAPISPAPEAVQAEPENSSENPSHGTVDSDEVVNSPRTDFSQTLPALANSENGGRDITPDMGNAISDITDRCQTPASPATTSRREVSLIGRQNSEDSSEVDDIEVDRTPSKRARLETSDDSVHVPKKRRKSSQPTKNVGSTSLATPTRRRRSVRVATQNVIELSAADTTGPRTRVIRSGRSGKGTWEEVSVGASDEEEN
ncbi:hypothetical protein E1B28_002129 [Marasmius oreades]|uniref:Uncharacterized protein n=1 Tax=Marasmius oreades TaxID=181124 RepID=A0A9P7RN33_9AGAR|nr:uncharacterized protein E1B28_002129 [Marasmius oreades]KAG7086170.1 hypothetical protein E1B28_002129 [Marasmius oreades]